MKLIDDEILKIVPKSELNGLGSKGLGWMVRDRWGGVDFSKAGDIHDSHYYLISSFYPYAANINLIDRIYPRSISFYRSLGTKREAINYANKTFYKNLFIINKEKSKTKLGYFMRKPILFSYYLSVKMFGRYFV